MGIKRTLTALRLDKIAAVGSPCQAPAVAAIIKHAPPKPVGAQAIAKATFGEALESNMIAGAVNEAFYQSFDGLWERNDAFRAALADEFAAGGDGTVASAAYVASVKALVDEAVAEARTAGASATDTTGIDKAFTTAVERWLKSRQQEQTDMIITTKADLTAAIAKFDPSKSPAAHIAIIKTAAKTLNAEDELPAAGLLAKDAPTTSDPELVRKVAILEMPVDVRKHFDGLDAAAQTTFLAKTAEQRAADVAKLNETDPVLHVTKAGLEIRKSDGSVALAMAKQLDAQADTIATLTTANEGSAIEKALVKFPHVNKRVATTMLKSVANGTDAEKAAVTEALVAMDKAARPAFQRFGNAGGGALDIAKGEHDAESPLGRMEAIVKRKMEAEPKLTKAQATVAVITDPDYAAAYADSLVDIPAVAAAQ